MLDAEARRRARKLARAYLKAGCIKHEFCAICHGFATQMHHPDYSKPALVIWLCGLCHWALHRDGSGTIQVTLMTFPALNRRDRGEAREVLWKSVQAAWYESLSRGEAEPMSRRAAIMRFIADGGVPAGSFS